MVREKSPSRSSSAQYSSPQKSGTARPPLANISAKMQSPSPKVRDSAENDETKRSGVDVEFGKASPLRNPLHGSKKPSSNIFVPKSRPQQSIRPVSAPRVPSYGNEEGFPSHKNSFYPPGQGPLSSSSALSSTDRNSGGPIEIPRPSNIAPKTIYPPPKPTFTSTGSNSFYLPGQAPKKVIDLTRGHDTDSDDDRFDPDAAIQADSRKFGSEDPYMYVDSSQANENIKKLLEGAFDDDEEKGRTRLRSRVKRAAKEEKESRSLASKLAALDVKDEEEEGEENEDEDDGTVEGMTVKLLPHQVEGVSWMIDKEISTKKTKGVLPHGGILADDMGLGKTVQSVTLMLTNPRPALDAKPEHRNQKLPGKEIGKGTLVVAPLALIKQWEAEIKAKVAKSHALRVLVHHGSSRTKSSDELKKYDVVITTYQTLTSEHAGSNMGVTGGARVGCFGVYWYRVILDEAHTIKNRNAKSTQACYALDSWYRWCLSGTPMQNNMDELQSLIKFLRIKPFCDLPRWKEQIIQPMKNGRGGLAMKRLQYFLRAFMKRRTKDILKQEGALNFGGKADKDGENNGGMQIVKREVQIVECAMDESEQRFYDRLQSRADKRLKDMMNANGKGDYIGALVLLLRLRQACDHPQLVEMSMNKDKDAMTTGLPSSQAPRKQNAGGDMDDLTTLMGGISMQNKTCDVCQVQLPPALAGNGAVRCSDCEADLIAVKKSKKGGKQRKEAKKAKAMADKRRARNRKVIDDSDEDDEGGGETLNTLDSERSEDEDSDIEDSPSRARRTATGSNKIEDESEGEEETDDASEEESESEDAEDESDSEADLLSGVAPSGKAKHVPSTKIRHLLRILHKESPEHKTIVFSQFTSMLDLVEPHLRASELRFVRYDGSMRPDAREQSLHSLRNDPKTRVLLCSLKCGSLGLNLTAASRVVILEPFWNPFVEEQAIDRVHRLNQTVDVKVFRLTIPNSVEERILDLQERKRELANAAIEGGNAIGKLSMQDILGLFRRDAEHEAHDAADRELWEKFGGDNRLLDGPGAVEAQEHVQDLDSSASRPMPTQQHKRTFQEHDVYGRRW